MLTLTHNFTFSDLYDRNGLIRLDKQFLTELKATDTSLYRRLLDARAAPDTIEEKAHSDLLTDLGLHVDDFVGTLFGAQAELLSLKAAQDALAPLYTCKRLFVQRRAAKAFKVDEVAGWDEPAFPFATEGKNSELSFATAVMHWLENEDAHAEALDTAKRYAAWALHHPEGQAKHAHGILFKQPHKLDNAFLIPIETIERDGVTMLKLDDNRLRQRDGFSLTDTGGTLEQALNHAHYCIWCHKQGKDSCSKGLKEKDGNFKINRQHVPLAGCPLEEKISEMHYLKAHNIPLGALAVAMVDNPMIAGTGHRICNDCMKACIYQKQEPVNIPMVETRILQDILDLPFGFEIYSLLTRWNPLNIHRPLPRPETGYKILIAGLGPAGYTLAHHLLNDGHTIVGIDGLKIEPLPPEVSGITQAGARVPFEPINDVQTLFEDLHTRVQAGFGGVAEYGITVRWNKNYLKLIRLLLERRQQFSMFGGVRFGGTITYDSAFSQLGFDHIALCLGAGSPNLLDIPNGLARGVRMASDFLMSLQLTGAAKPDSIANMQLRLPAVVIGGGLTAIDTATEALAYYPIQVEKFLHRYEQLVNSGSELSLRASWSTEESQLADEYIAHAKAIREEKSRAVKEGRMPDVLSLLNTWGGVTVAYRKSLQDAPSYRLNHEEVEKALEEGIRFAEYLTPERVEVDEFGAVKAIVLNKANPIEASLADSGNSSEDALSQNNSITFPARTVLIAAGTRPNTVLHREDPEHFPLEGKYFQAVGEDGAPVLPEHSAKPKTPHILMSLDDKNRAVSYFGDLHPSFAGNVVKAMGSAKQGYPTVSNILKRRTAQPSDSFLSSIHRQLAVTVHQVNRLTPTIIEVVLHAPLAAAEFQPGQFYRLHNFETSPSSLYPERKGAIPPMEGLAMTGAWVDKARGLISIIALEMGGSSNLCAHLQPGEPVILMGPTGTPTEIPKDKTILLIGGGLGNAVLFSIGRALRANGCQVLYFAGYKRMEDIYKREEIEAAADHVVWCCDEKEPEAKRARDFSYHGNMLEALLAYAEGTLGAQPIALTEVDHLITIGSDRLMAAIKEARHTVLKKYLKSNHQAIGSINSPMQCMMKEICAQCLQKHCDPETGKEIYVYSCYNQDQPLDWVDFAHLHARLHQNSLQEKLTASWITHCF